MERSNARCWIGIVAEGDDDSACSVCECEGSRGVRRSRPFLLNSGSLELGSPSQHHAYVSDRLKYKPSEPTVSLFQVLIYYYYINRLRALKEQSEYQQLPQ
jgi:hypothetical protein